RRLIAWFGPRGLSTLLLVLLPVFAGVVEAPRLFAVAALVVLLSVVLHGGGIALFLRRQARATSHAQPAAPVVAAPPRLDDEVAERLTILELRALWQRHEPVIVIDARTERSYRDDALRARDAVRLVPDDA